MTDGAPGARRHDLAMGLASYSAAQRSVTNRQIKELDDYISQLKREKARLSTANSLVISDFSNGQ